MQRSMHKGVLCLLLDVFMFWCFRRHGAHTLPEGVQLQSADSPLAALFTGASERVSEGGSQCRSGKRVCLCSPKSERTLGQCRSDEMRRRVERVCVWVSATEMPQKPERGRRGAAVSRWEWQLGEKLLSVLRGEKTCVLTAVCVCGG